MNIQACFLLAIFEAVCNIFVSIVIILDWP